MYTHRPQGVFETVIGVAKTPERNAWSCDAVSREHRFDGLHVLACRVFVVIRNGINPLNMLVCFDNGCSSRI